MQCDVKTYSYIKMNSIFGVIHIIRCSEEVADKLRAAGYEVWEN